MDEGVGVVLRSALEADRRACVAVRLDGHGLKVEDGAMDAERGRGAWSPQRRRGYHAAAGVGTAASTWPRARATSGWRSVMRGCGRRRGRGEVGVAVLLLGVAAAGVGAGRARRGGRLRCSVVVGSWARCSVKSLSRTCGVASLDVDSGVVGVEAWRRGRGASTASGSRCGSAVLGGVVARGEVLGEGAELLLGRRGRGRCRGS